MEHLSELPQPNQVIPECDSTNRLAQQLGKSGAPHGSWISARKQTAGRGRLGRKWESSEGNLFLSIIVRPKDQQWLTWIPLTTAVGVSDALLKLYPQVNLKLKWPNDLWIEGAKLGGILCEAVGGKTDSFVIIGIGLNCAAAPEGLDQQAISLSASLRQLITADQVREQIIESVLARVDELQAQGGAGIAAGYESRAALPAGTRIEWKSERTGADQGTVLGLGPMSELRVRSDSRGEISLYSEDVKIRAAPRASGEFRP